MDGLEHESGTHRCLCEILENCNFVDYNKVACKFRWVSLLRPVTATLWCVLPR